MIDCLNEVTVCQSDTSLDKLCRVVTLKASRVLQFGARGQDIRSRGAGAGSRGATDDCCEQGLGRSSPDAPAVNTRYLNRLACQRKSYADAI